MGPQVRLLDPGGQVLPDEQVHDPEPDVRF